MTVFQHFPLNIIEQVLLCGSDEWEKVAAQYRKEIKEIDFCDIKI